MSVTYVSAPVQDAMDLFLGVHVVSRDEGVTIPSVLQQPRNLRMTVVRGCWVAASGVCQVFACVHMLCLCVCVCACA